MTKTDWSAGSPTRVTGIIKFCELPDEAYDWQWHYSSSWKECIWVEAYWLLSRPREIDIVDVKSAMCPSKAFALVRTTYVCRSDSELMVIEVWCKPDKDAVIAVYNDLGSTLVNRLLRACEPDEPFVKKAIRIVGDLDEWRMGENKPTEKRK